MKITAEIQARVTAKLVDGIARAEAKYGMKFAMPTVSYDLRGTVAGYANYRLWTIRLNAVLLLENVDTFIARTVPHELAHLINDKVYPDAHAFSVQVTRSGRLKRTKREVHGPSWQSVCRVLGMSDVTRCHSYDVSNSKVVKSNGRQIEWKCGCGASLMLTPKKSALLDINPKALWHRGCRDQKLTRVQALPVVDLSKYGAVVHPSLPTTKYVPPPLPGVTTSKIDLCKALYTKHRSATRAQLIAMFIGQAGCTAAGAGTYYATCKKVYG